MSCTRSNSAFANKILKQLRVKLSTGLPAAYPRAFTWALYTSDGTVIVTHDPPVCSPPSSSHNHPFLSPIVHMLSAHLPPQQESETAPESVPVSAGSLGTGLVRLMEAAVGFANTVTSSTDAPAEIVHIAGSKVLFTVARFGTAGFVLAFFSALAAPPAPAPARPAPATAATATEDVARSTFDGDSALRALLDDLHYILTSVRLPTAAAATPAASPATPRRLSADETAPDPASGRTSPVLPPASSTTRSQSRSRHKSQHFT